MKVSKLYCHYLIENVKKEKYFLHNLINLNRNYSHIIYITLFSLSDILMYIKSKLYKVSLTLLPLKND